MVAVNASAYRLVHFTVRKEDLPLLEELLAHYHPRARSEFMAGKRQKPRVLLEVSMPADEARRIRILLENAEDVIVN